MKTRITLSPKYDYRRVVLALMPETQIFIIVFTLLTVRHLQYETLIPYAFVPELKFSSIISASSRNMRIICHALDQARVIANITNAFLFFKAFHYV